MAPKRDMLLSCLSNEPAVHANEFHDRCVDIANLNMQVWLRAHTYTSQLG